MAEYDTVTVTNILDEEVSVTFNGEPYVLAANELKSYPSFLGFHIAKTISDKILVEEAKAVEKENPDNPYAPAAGQLLIHDNPRRRILLYQILGSQALVESCVNAYPLKSFLGDMQEYINFVEGQMEIDMKQKEATEEAEPKKEAKEPEKETSDEEEFTKVA